MNELETFVTGYMEQAGGLVEQAGYGIYEVLLPDEAAERWHTAAYQQIAFTAVPEENVTRLGYNHPLVEQIAAEARAQTASTQAYINELRLDKKELDKLAASGWVIANGRVRPKRRAAIARARSAYVRFNFKAALLSDEKEERLVSALLDAHTGCPAADAAFIENRATAAAPDTVLRSLPVAPLRWQPGSGRPPQNPLDQRVLEALLDRAKTAVLQEMSGRLDRLQSRMNRFRELDEARLTEYYDELERDLQTRLSRAVGSRRDSLADKLETVKTERARKLDNIAERYRVRLDLTLLNLKVIWQPKLLLPVSVESRAVKTNAYAVWDPLRHQLEPLICAVCGQPIRQRAWLCHNGHLAHEECLVPGCVDCKRVFCRQCADEVGECAVCHQPLCRFSRIACPECGRGTCQAHQGMCHADEGKPVDLTAQSEAPPPEPEAKPQMKPAVQPQTKPVAKPPRRAAKKSPPPRKRKPAVKRPQMPKGVPRPQRIEVVVSSEAVAAFVLASRERQIAVRIWELDPESGILISCECEKKTACQADGMIMRPSDLLTIKDQLWQEITSFRQEYGLPPKKMKFNRLLLPGQPPSPMRSFRLFGLWQDEATLVEARAGFDRAYW